MTNGRARKDRIVCRCNWVTHDEIEAAIDVDGAATVEEVARKTTAGLACGSCRTSVARVLGSRLGAAPGTTAGICGCTELDHDAIRDAIVRSGYAEINQVFRALDWKNEDGCARCRPAVNYYLLCARPDGYADDPQSRHGNERVHANIQRDGTYSVVPRVFGGMLSPAQLRALADTAERHGLGTVKITGAQRIDLLGVRKEQLPSVWRDLNAAGFISGHAYARAVRTVKTCVGSEWCRYGIHDAVRLGVALEEMAWGSWTPHKVKLAVSGCARNCAEAMVKDFGVVAVERGWDIYVGGSAGYRVRAGNRLVRVTTERDVLELCGAFIQLYREEGWYGERTAAFISRVGMDYARDRLVHDPYGRSSLFRAFYRSQHGKQRDPWQEIQQRNPGSFVPLSRLMGNVAS